MSFNFSPLLCFVCRLCKRVFPDTEKLNQHKLEHHLADCHKIKCIIFEEQYLDQEFIPGDLYFLNQNSMSNSYPAIDPSVVGQTARDSDPRNSFVNPFVPIKLLTSEQLTEGRSDSENTSVNNSDPDSFDQDSTRRRSTRLQNISPVSSPLQNEPPVSKKRKIIYSYNKQSTFSEPSSPINEDQDDEESKSQSSFATSTSADANVEEISIQPKVELLDALIVLGHKETELVPQAHIYNSNSEMDPNTSNRGRATEIYFKSQSQHQDQDSVNGINDLLTNVKVECTVPSFEIIKGEISNAGKKPEESQSQAECQENILQENKLNDQDHDEPQFVGEVGRRFVCKICSIGFRYNCRLRRHTVTVHTSEKLFKCRQCPASFKIKSSLEKHLIVHGRVTGFKCQFCGRSFHDNRDLTNHERTHTGERPFRCTVPNCSARFSTKSGRATHKKIRHNEELGLNRFPCSICGETFGFQYLLKTHLQLRHSDTKPFPCLEPGCGKEFTTKKCLTKHCSKIHGNSDGDGYR